MVILYLDPPKYPLLGTIYPLPQGYKEGPGIHKHLRVVLGFEGFGFKVQGQQAAVYAGFVLDPLHTVCGSSCL